MASQSNPSAVLSYPVSVSARVRSAALDRVNVALTAVFLLVATFFFWRATVAEPLALHGGQGTPYNQLADAFIHLHVWVVHVPAAGSPRGILTTRQNVRPSFSAIQTTRYTATTSI